MEPASENQPTPNSRLRRLARTLRNLTALGLLTLSFGVLALWARSYLRADELVINRCLTIESASGLILTSLYPNPVPQNRETIWFRSIRVPPTFGSDAVRAAWSFSYSRIGQNLYLTAPHWFIALAFAALAFALKPEPRLRLSLSDLLVLMTFSAVLIAAVARLTRLAS